MNGNSLKEIAQAQLEIRNNPRMFLEDMVGIQPWDKQIEVIQAVRDNKRVSVRSCNGAGKTYLLPRLAMWYLASFSPSVVINTAPTWRQIENQYWRHFRAAHDSAIYPMSGKIFKTKFEIDEDYYALGVSVKRTEDFQGWHSPNIMVVVDEASGVNPMIYEAINGIISGGENTRLVLIGNPNQNQGDFYDSFTDPSFKQIHISAFDIPNVKEKRHVIPGLSTLDWVEEMKKKYGEDHDVYRVRVLGEPPLQGDNILIPVQLVSGAIGADREQYGDDEVIALDVARFGNDRSGFIHRKGNKAKVLEVIQKNDLMELSGRAKNYLKEYPNAILAIDVIGLGAGVYDRLKEQPDVANRVYAVNFSQKANDTEKYFNLRAEAWGNAKEWLRDGILEDHEEWYQLCKPKYKITSNGQIQLESKDEMKKRGIPSPDIGDCLAMSLCRRDFETNRGVVWI